MYDFNRKVNYTDVQRLTLAQFEATLTPEDRHRLEKIKDYWNFYEGYHWENVGESDKPQITENYCRRFVDKFVSFELGLGFTVSVPSEQKDVEDTETPVNVFLDEVWKENNKDTFCIELGQSKSITGDGWVQVRYESPDQLNDPYGEFPKGRIRVQVIPSNIVFPIYDNHDKDRLLQVIIAYPIEVHEYDNGIIKKQQTTPKIYKQIWGETYVEEWIGNEQISTYSNPYGTIPFVQIKNYPLVGRTTGISDLEDIIPLNMELNFKKSDISEIIDYHSAPVTVVYGAKVSALEKGANKVWGGLPKDAKVHNLELNSDLGASVNYTEALKTTIHEVGSIPEGALGGSQAISNTSGVALQFVNMPLIERTRVKQNETAKGLHKINKLILLIAVTEGLFSIPEGMNNKDFYTTEITFPDALPKDRLIELQQIQLELQLGLESKKGAMRRLNKENITLLLEEIEQERKEEVERALELQQQQAQINVENQIMSAKLQSEAHAPSTPKAESNKTDDKKSPKLNSGLTNGSTPVEQVRKEVTGNNGMNKEI